MKYFKSINIILFVIFTTLCFNRINSQTVVNFDYQGGSVDIGGAFGGLQSDDAPHWITIENTPVQGGYGYQTSKLICSSTIPGDSRSATIHVSDFANSINVTYIVNQTAENCISWYPDSDGDGFGDIQAQPIIICIGTVAPFSGAVTNNEDACPEFPSFVNNGCEPGYIHEDMNWTMSKAYDINGNLKAIGKSYFDALGKGIQTQTLDIETDKVWATETLYDAQGRPALQTLNAPIDNYSGNFNYKPDFIKKEDGISNYTESDFEADPENPEPVGRTANTLGHYYSLNNTDSEYQGNAYQDVTAYPFSRTIYSELNPGAGLKTLGGNKIDTDNNGTPDSWLQGYTYSIRASQELSQTDAFNDPKYDDIETIKTIARDVHGVETVVFNDTDGKTLAAARSGDATARLMNITIGEQGFVDIHVPKGDNMGFTVNSSDVTIYDLITEQPTTVANVSLPNGFYRVAVNNPAAYVPGSITVSYKENYYDYSLNEYDKAGRLTASYQPLHHLKSTFTYNSLGQLLTSSSPDEGEAEFKYRKDGQIRFSQNSKQKDPNDDGVLTDSEYSYTNYDELGRPTESGVVFSNDFISNDFNSLNPDDLGLPQSALINRKEQNFTVYDELLESADLGQTSDLDFLATLHTDYHNPTFLASNVAKTSNSSSTTYYSYDIYGRVKWLIQNINGLGVKTIDYKYDPITGSVLEVDFQKHTPSEHFVHKYTYNIVDQLIQVETSTDGITFSNQAKYFYYETGALRRTELADNLQGLDYVYNLAGQLKAINDPQGNDPGGDGSAGIHSNFSPDVFSMTLDYYKGDYTRTGTPTTIASVADGTNQYNGNIKAMTWKTNHPSMPDTQTYYYGYNKNNWLESAGLGAPVNGGSAVETVIRNNAITANEEVLARQSITLGAGFHVAAGIEFIARIDPNATGANTGDYNVSNLTYDQNGNILSLNRNKQSENGGSNEMDQLTYEYYDDPNDPNNDFKPNQLKRVDDAAGEVAGADDIGDQNGDNYVYNQIGQLVRNNEEGIIYEYNASGLVSNIKKVSVAWPNGYPYVSFYYNDRGHRIQKRNWFDETDTYYVRDVSGNTLAIYQNNVLTELPIYGASRLGVHYKNSTGDKDVYQLTDHLGNVRGVIERSNPQPTTTTDYYPFGMPMQGRQTVGGELYRYAFQGQEKDLETGKEAFELRLWDARIGRWLSPDPYKEFPSPYLGMGNTPNMTIDSDGGCTDPPCDVDGGMLDEVIVVARGNGQMTSELNSQYDYGGTFAQWQVQYGYDGIDYNNARALWESQDNGAWAAQVAQWDRDGRNQVLLGKLQFFTGPFKASEDLAEVLPGTAAVNTTRSAIRAFKYIPRFKVKIHVKIHGNSLDSPRPTWFYKLYNVDGTFLKNGITSEIIPQARYTKKFMSTHKMGDLQLFPNRRGAYDFEFLQNTIEPGPLNLNMH